MKKILKGVACGMCALLGLTAAAQEAVQVNIPAVAPTKVKHPCWSRNAVIYEVNLRQFTDEGTLQAFDKETHNRRGSHRGI